MTRGIGLGMRRTAMGLNYLTRTAAFLYRHDHNAQSLSRKEKRPLVAANTPRKPPIGIGAMTASAVFGDLFAALSAFSFLLSFMIFVLLFIVLICFVVLWILGIWT